MWGLGMGAGRGMAAGARDGRGAACGRGGTDAGWDAVRDIARELRPDAPSVRTFGR